MSCWIETVSPEAATGALRAIYEQVARRRGRVTNFALSGSLDPGVLEAFFNLYTRLMKGEGPLSPRQREILAVTVCRLNRCRYCLTAHTADLAAQAGVAVADAVAAGRDHPDLGAADRALIGLATVTVTGAGEAERRAAIESARAAGLDDAAVLRAVHLIGIFQYVTSWVEALGVAPEPV